MERPQGRIPLSDALRKFLVREPQFHDLEQAPYEWRYFFLQFELYRLQHFTGCGYLLPICLGPSLRGLLFIPGDDTSGKKYRLGIDEYLSASGLEGCGTSSPAPSPR